MEVTIEAYADYFEVRINGRKIGIWTYLDGAIEAVRLEILARYPLEPMNNDIFLGKLVERQKENFKQIFPNKE